MLDDRLVATPVEAGALEALTAEYGSSQNPKIEKGYAEAIGSLMCLSTMTRPDLAFVTSFLARFMSAPTERHWGAIKRVMRYLAQTMDLGLWFNGPDLGDNELAAFSDSDWAGCRITRTSTTGLIIQLAGGAVSRRSARQKCVSPSSCEAEFVVGSAAAQEVKWLRSLLKAINPQGVVGPTRLMIDNTGAAELASDL
ncbi:MAG: hypothetical protein BJ554DRAFT_6163 [Olpidium bornovanus]|uniref:Polyprotein n=1 Tax=Olpidium bornovanus TaxID=278681 RepID=A0A8H8DKF1_9FUNG|nr:MAG: hypothetical protein BJ554DRAFT_6163 [Olpidium bornovanus]